MFTDTIDMVVYVHIVRLQEAFLYTEIIVYRLVGDIKRDIFSQPVMDSRVDCIKSAIETPKTKVYMWFIWQVSEGVIYRTYKNV